MRNGPRWLFILACVLALAAVVQGYRFDASTRVRQAAGQDIQRALADLRVSLGDVRAGQTAYIAAGQGPDFWMRKVTDTVSAMEASLGVLRSQVSTPQTIAELSKASTSLAELVTLDGRARQAVEGNQRFLASDVIFGDSLGPTQAVAEAIAGAAASEATALDAAIARTRWINLGMMAAALVLLMGAGVLWAQTQAAAPANPAAGVAQMLRDLPPPVRAPQQQPAPVAPPRPTAPVPALVVDLDEAAELCVDLARVVNTQDVSALLGRTAKALDASGLVVWVTSADGRSLQPALTFGYSDKVVSRLGTLEIEADNLTSACFRSKRSQTMSGIGQPGATSALAVPLVTADGCHGVMSAELRVIKPSTDTISLARIVGAQLATMMSPGSVSETPTEDVDELGDDLESRAAQG